MEKRTDRLGRSMRTSNTMGGETPRASGDAYPTPDRLAQAIANRLVSAIGDVDLVVEPSAGDGAFVVAAQAAWGQSVRVHAVEPIANAAVHRMSSNFVSSEASTWEAAEQAGKLLGESVRSLILGNPPYMLAELHVRLALERLGHNVALEPKPKWLAFLLRASFLAGGKRSEGLHMQVGGLRYVWHVVGRPSFTSDGKTDGAEYACLVWQAGWRGPYEGGWLTWR